MMAVDRSRRKDDIESDETAVPLLTINSASRSRLELTSEKLGTTTSTSHMSSSATARAGPGPQSLSISRYESDKEQYRERVDTVAPLKYARRTPLPLMQLFVLCTMRLAEPIAYTQIFPVCTHILLGAIQQF